MFISASFIIIFIAVLNVNDDLLNDYSNDGSFALLDHKTFVFI
uniref:Uncharacterized protein n=1 Tax=Ascaris lumbricoides TaxID=6252 RepID=A0A0M3ITC3_ASCLU